MPEVIGEMDTDVRLYAATKKGYLLQSEVHKMDVHLNSHGLPQNMGFRKLNCVQQCLIEWAKEIIKDLEIR